MPGTHFGAGLGDGQQLGAGVPLDVVDVAGRFLAAEQRAGHGVDAPSAGVDAVPDGHFAAVRRPPDAAEVHRFRVDQLRPCQKQKQRRRPFKRIICIQLHGQKIEIKLQHSQHRLAVAFPRRDNRNEMKRAKKNKMGYPRRFWNANRDSGPRVARVDGDAVAGVATLGHGHVRAARPEVQARPAVLG